MPEGLVVKNCVVQYPGVDRKALNKVTFSLPRGSFSVLAGASGSGKTTLLKAIAGLVDITIGSIYWKDTCIEGPSSRLVAGYQQIRLITQELDLQEKMTVYENLRHALRAFSEPYKSQRVDELLNLCQIKGFEDRLPYQLSGGQRQRVVWAINLADEPELLLLDEPFSHLDVMLKSEMTELLRDIHKSLKITVVMVTHDSSDALSLGQKILLLKSGKVEMLDTPKNVYFHPATTYSASFFGEVNLLSSDDLKNLLVRKKAETFRKWMIRPEAIKISKNQTNIHGQVVRSEFRGFYYLLTFLVGNIKIKTVLEKTLPIGSSHFLLIPTDQLHGIY